MIDWASLKPVTLSLVMPPPPLLGYNNNIRHRRRVFHIQTEDSGAGNPRIMTHLFADGGRIVKSIRTDYAEHVERKDMAVFVKNMMKEQHKAMFVALRSGELDRVIGFDESSPPPSTASPQSVLGSAAVLLEVDSSESGENEQGSGAKSARAPRSEPASSTKLVSSQSAEDEAKSYAASRPAAIFSVHPRSSGNIFGGVGLDEKSLDDAILSYLAEDPAEKKAGEDE